MRNSRHFIYAVMGTCLLFFTQCTEDSGTVEVHYQEATAIYGDMDDIRNKELIAPVREIINPGKLYIGERFILVGEEGEGIHVVDNTNRKSPSASIFIQLPGNREFIVEDHILYAESYYDVVKIDIRNPSQPILLARAENAIQDQFKDSQGKTLIGFNYTDKSVVLNQDDDFYKEIVGDQLVYLDFAENIIPNSAVPSSFAGNSSSQSGTVNRLAKTKGHLYLISHSNMIVIPDNDNFSSQSNQIRNIQEGMETIFPHGDHLFVGSRTSMSIYDLQNEMRPILITEFDHASSCDPVLPHEDVAYVTLRTADFSDCPGNINALLVIDVTDVRDARLLEEIAMASPYGMSIINEDLYVGEGENGLKIYDISNRKKPILKEQHDIEAYDVIVDPTNKNVVFIAGPNGLSQFLVDDEASVFDLQSQLSY